MALTDDRTLNKCVQMDFNGPTEQENLDMLKKNFPDHHIEYMYYAKDDIVHARDTAGDEVSAKKGAETDKERWGINYVIYVKGKMASFTEETIRGTDLYPDYECLSKPEIALADRAFVFGKE